MIVKTAFNRNDADNEMQQGKLDKAKTSTSNEVTEAKKPAQQLPRALANETKSDDMKNFESPGTGSHQPNTGPPPKDASNKTQVHTNKSQDTSSSASNPSLSNSSNDSLKRSPTTDAEIWSEVRNHSLSQLLDQKSLLQQELRFLKKSLSPAQGDGLAKTEEIQSLQQIVRRHSEIVKNAIFLLELGKEVASTTTPKPGSQQSPPRRRPNLLAEFKEEQMRLTKDLKSFEDEFAVQHGRPISSAIDIETRVHQYRRLQKLQGASAALRLEHDYKRHERDQRQSKNCVQ